MILVGCDPGSKYLGWCRFDQSTWTGHGGVLRLKGDVNARLLAIPDLLRPILQGADLVSIERQIRKGNRGDQVLPRVVQQVRNVAAELGISVEEIGISEARSLVTGYGGADKAQVKSVLRVCHGYECELLDESDAACVAIGTLMKRGNTALEAKAARPRRRA